MLKLRPWLDAGGVDGGALRGNPVAARQWLDRHLIDDADAALARGYALGLADGTELSRLDDAQLKDHLCPALTTGRLAVTRGTPVVLRALTQSVPPAAAPATEAPASRPRTAPAPAPTPAADTTFEPNLDVAAQVSALKQAAQDGVPFCEECARAAAKQTLEAAAA